MKLLLCFLLVGAVVSQKVSLLYLKFVLRKFHCFLSSMSLGSVGVAEHHLPMHHCQSHRPWLDWRLDSSAILLTVSSLAGMMMITLTTVQRQFSFQQNKNRRASLGTDRLLLGNVHGVFDENSYCCYVVSVIGWFLVSFQRIVIFYGFLQIVKILSTHNRIMISVNEQ